MNLKHLLVTLKEKQTAVPVFIHALPLCALSSVPTEQFTSPFSASQTRLLPSTKGGTEKRHGIPCRNDKSLPPFAWGTGEG